MSLLVCLVGEKGHAYTLITEKDKDFAGPLVRNMEAADQFVPKLLMDLALQVPCLFVNKPTPCAFTKSEHLEAWRNM